MGGKSRVGEGKVQGKINTLKNIRCIKKAKLKNEAKFPSGRKKETKAIVKSSIKR